MKFALNQATTPNLSFEAFLDLAAALGCVGVEPRNDLQRPLFDGLVPSAAGELTRGKGLRMVGLSQVYPFNDWTTNRAAEVSALIETAAQAGAETISLIPRVDGRGIADGERQATLRRVLRDILPMLRGTGIIGLVEPIGFPQSSLRVKSEAVAAIEDIGGTAHFKLVHDTFQHALAEDTEFFPRHTGIVHISGISDRESPVTEKLDAERKLIDAGDRLDNIGQIRTLNTGGYEGVFSFECTSPDIHALRDPEAPIRKSIEYLTDSLHPTQI